MKDRRTLSDKRSIWTFNFSVSGWLRVLKDISLLNLKITELIHIRYEKLVCTWKMLVFFLTKRFLNWFCYYLHCDYLFLLLIWFLGTISLKLLGTTFFDTLGIPFQKFNFVIVIFYLFNQFTTGVLNFMPYWNTFLN